MAAPRVRPQDLQLYLADLAVPIRYVDSLEPSLLRGETGAAGVG
jgi:hypothetical protein